MGGSHLCRFILEHATALNGGYFGSLFKTEAFWAVRTQAGFGAGVAEALSEQQVGTTIQRKVKLSEVWSTLAEAAIKPGCQMSIGIKTSGETAAFSLCTHLVGGAA